MELDSLKRCLSELKEIVVTLRTLTTDGHHQFEAVFAKQKEITHYFDTWHVVKRNCSILLHFQMWLQVLIINDVANIIVWYENYYICLIE